MAEKSVTRGYGLLEKVLAMQRAKVANRHITSELRSGRLLDIGCGAYPYFLTNTEFKEKFGLDSVGLVSSIDPIVLVRQDLSKKAVLPFDSNFFDVVTMLAVVEHLEAERLSGVLSEIRRVLKSGGLLVLTTPTRCADTLLKVMAKLWLVSSTEIEDHKDVYDHPKIKVALRNAGFTDAQITCGYFEFFMNLWTVAKKRDLSS